MDNEHLRCSNEGRCLIWRILIRDIIHAARTKACRWNYYWFCSFVASPYLRSRVIIYYSK